jgi:outer membrane protein
VTRDNQRPVLIQRRSDRDLAYMRLKQLMDMPLDAPIQLATDLGDDTIGAASAQFTGLQTNGDTATAARAPVRQAAEAVTVQENFTRIARAQRYPGVSLTSQFGRVAYPSGGIPSWSEFRSNWTVGLSMQVPLVTGGRIRGDEMVAAANLADARARLEQTRELAALDTRSALERLQAAEASWRSSAGTVQQATRAYTIAELRYKEGISTQIEVADSRILLQQAQANRAQAARDLQIARVRLALLPDLPLGTAGSGAAAAGQSGSSAVQPQQQQPQPRQQAPAQRGGTVTSTQASTVGTP